MLFLPFGEDCREQGERGQRRVIRSYSRVVHTRNPSVARPEKSGKLQAMSAIAKTVNWIAPEDYLEGERRSEIRHEYIDGVVYAMAGSSNDHNRIGVNIRGKLRGRLRVNRCGPFMVAIKVKAPPAAAN